MTKFSLTYWHLPPKTISIYTEKTRLSSEIRHKVNGLAMSLLYARILCGVAQIQYQNDLSKNNLASLPQMKTTLHKNLLLYQTRTR